MITIEQSGNRILLSGGYTPNLGKYVPGAYFRRGEKRWSLPLSLETCKLLREHFGQTLQVGPQLCQWAWTEVKRQEELGALATARDAVLTRVPEMAPQLDAAYGSRKFQKVAPRFIADARAVLLADEQGLGKTLEAIGGILESGQCGPYLIVCPKTAVESVWARELARWVPGDTVVTVPEGRAKRDAILGAVRGELGRTWVVVHPEMVLVKSYWECEECGEQTTYTRKPTPILKCGHLANGVKTQNDPTYPQFFGIEWGAIVVDECHEVLVMKTGTPTQRRRGMELLRDLLRTNGVLIAASGTPMRGKPHQLWGVLNWLDPKTYSGKWSWIGKFWELGGYSGYEIGRLRPERERMLWDSLRPIVLRRTKAEVAPDMPPKRWMGTPLEPSDPDSPLAVWLPMSGEQLRNYESMRDTGRAKLRGGVLEAVGPLAELTRLRQLACTAGAMVGSQFRPALPSNKFDYLVQLLDELGIPGQPITKVVVVSQWTEHLELFAHGLRAQGIDSMMLTGKVSAKKRAENLKLFNTVGAGPFVMLMNVKAGGVAITIDTADVMVFIDEDPVPDVQAQAEDRIHRLSKPRKVQYHYLRTLDTVEVGAALVAADRSTQTRRLLDDRRGVEYATRVMELSHG